MTYAACLLATPGIQGTRVPCREVQCPENAIGRCLFGIVFEQAARTGILRGATCRHTDVHPVKAYLPVKESFGFNGRSPAGDGWTGGVPLQSVFDHWELMNGTPLDKGSKLEDMVKGIRTRKGLKVQFSFTCQVMLPSLTHTPTLVAMTSPARARATRYHVVEHICGRCREVVVIRRYS